MSVTIDLHLHSNFSDGTHQPGELMELCARQGFETVALADHDTIDGLPSALEAGRDLGIEVLPAVEMSAGNDLEIHILGYFVDVENDQVVAWLRQLKQERLVRVARMVDRLREVGLHLALEDVQAQAGERASIGRMHIALALVEKGYAQDVSHAFKSFLQPGKPGYIKRNNLQAAELIGQMEALGMVTSLAHGAKIDLPLGRLLPLLTYFTGAGLRGFECYHSSYTLSMERFMRNQAERGGLFITGGSDFHGDNKPGLALGDGLAGWTDAQDCLEKLKSAKKE